MARLALISVIVVMGSASASAGIAVDAGVPFTAAELSLALAARGAATADLIVRAVSPTAVELSTGGGRQRVELGATRGAGAARLVALQLASLGGDAALAARSEAPGAWAPPAESPWVISLAAGGGHGAASIDFAFTALRLDLMQHRGRWRLGLGAAWLHGLARSPDGRSPATAELYPVRAVAGAAVGPLEVVAGPELVRYSLTAAGSDTTFGAGAGIRLRLASIASWQAIASADVDSLLHRVALSRSGSEFAATPRVALTAAIGLAWEGL